MSHTHHDSNDDLRRAQDRRLREARDMRQRRRELRELERRIREGRFNDDEDGDE